MHSLPHLPTHWVVWVFSQSRSRGVHLAGVRVDGRGGSVPCEPGEVFVHALAPGLRAHIEQRPGCSGLLTSLRFDVDGELVGAWVQDRLPDERENPAWPQLLVEALVLAQREAALEHEPPVHARPATARVH